MVVLGRHSRTGSVGLGGVLLGPRVPSAELVGLMYLRRRATRKVAKAELDFECRADRAYVFVYKSYAKSDPRVPRLIGGRLNPVVDLIGESTAAYSLKCRFPRETGRIQAPRCQQGPTGPGPTDEHSVHPHHRDFIVTPIADQIGPIDSVSKTEYYDLKNHFSEPQCKMTVLSFNIGNHDLTPVDF
ncbi:casein kinase I-like [Dorcoceras hygrometricum]|uniref:Casein kinase I-like n=1 Tax=Dorcoceras hygrometricum TaxID=472368 RepID=A0A2Z7AGG0_9LAMI|nr:casein kinase I-like [Dorcoceras hygrometricum]